MPGVTLLSDSGDLVFAGGELFGRPVSKWIFSFWQRDHFWLMQVYLKNDSSTNRTAYEEVQRSMIAEFGPPEREDHLGQGGPRTAHWSEKTEGVIRENTLSIALWPRKGIAIWYGAHAYVEMHEKGNL